MHFRHQHEQHANAEIGLTGLATVLEMLTFACKTSTAKKSKGSNLRDLPVARTYISVIS
jgi:hypothetical protein